MLCARICHKSQDAARHVYSYGIIEDAQPLTSSSVFSPFNLLTSVLTKKSSSQGHSGADGKREKCEKATGSLLSALRLWWKFRGKIYKNQGARKANMCQRGQIYNFVVLGLRQKSFSGLGRQPRSILFNLWHTHVRRQGASGRLLSVARRHGDYII